MDVRDVFRCRQCLGREHTGTKQPCDGWLQH
jgi:hypothetical protein